MPVILLFGNVLSFYFKQANINRYNPPNKSYFEVFNNISEHKSGLKTKHFEIHYPGGSRKLINTVKKRQGGAGGGQVKGPEGAGQRTEAREG